MKRHLPGFHCPVCDGHAELPRERGVRCAGFTLDLVSYCTREQLSGRLTLDVGVAPPAYKHVLRGGCGCGLTHGQGPVVRLVSKVEPRTSLHIDVRDAIYSRLLEMLPLRDEAFEDLMRRGLALSFIEQYGFRSLPQRGGEQTEVRDLLVREFGNEVLARCPGTHDKNGRVGIRTASERLDGYFVPYRDENGSITGLQIRAFSGLPKYRTVLGSVISEVYTVAGPVHVGCDLWLTEGGSKAVVAAHVRPGLVCFGVPGQALQPNHLAVMKRIAPRRVIVALDRENNVQTDRIREKWLDSLVAEGFETYDAVWAGAA